MASEPIVQPAGLVQETQFTTNSSQDRDSSAPLDQAPVPAATAQKKTPRALGPDLLRGLIIVFQALDHAAVASGAWRHGVGLESEADGQLVDTWNTPVGWTARMLTHLCAPGFTFLLGMGVVYFGKSRSKLGWTRWQMVKHFFVRAFVLALVNQLLGSLLFFGWKLALFNIVLLALAIDYFLAGLTWLVVDEAERAILSSFEKHSISAEVDETQPLLSDNQSGQRLRASSQIVSVTYHAINVILLAFSAVSIGWNIWLSPDGGHCKSSSQSTSDMHSLEKMQTQKPSLFAFLFYPVFSENFISGFPPFAWLAYAFLGILYARLMINYKPSARLAATFTAAAGAFFAIMFVLTRLLHFGNLSEDCLKMPENLAHPEVNQYLVSFRAFFYATKYPPDFAFFCYSMAMNMWLLAVFSILPTLPPKEDIEGKEGRLTVLLRGFYGILLPFGQCALFFYTLHLVLYTNLSAIVKRVWGHKLGFTDPLTGEPAIGIGNGLIFWVYYLGGLVILWFACQYYARFKGGKGPNSIWRFF